MTIYREKKGDSLTIRLEGRLDTITSPDFDREMEEDLPGIRHLTIDMEGLEYISSAGLRSILATHKRMKTQGTMQVIHPGEMVREVFEVTGFDEILDLD